MLALPYVLHFLTHELAGLSGGRFALAGVFPCPFGCVFSWHIHYCFAVNDTRGRNNAQPDCGASDRTAIRGSVIRYS